MSRLELDLDKNQPLAAMAEGTEPSEKALEQIDHFHSSESHFGRFDLKQC
jgi:hypothetical protein